MRPHTVILGAGATIAAIPNGDKRGRKSSVMSGLINNLGLADSLREIQLQTSSDNLEDIYTELYSRKDCEEIRLELEKRIYRYFSELQLPAEPTVYDMLVLSLTSKDAIATFNWDPLLLQAYVRCSGLTDNLPHIYCLHGNVDMGYCSDDVEFGVIGATCPVCNRNFTPTKLLYPVRNKNYEDDEYISKCWEATRSFINQSYMITVFGYSAPVTDSAAIDLMKSAWGNVEDRQLEEVSVIDIISEDDMLKRWSSFIHTHHYRYTNNFYSSYLGMFPRRTCETVFGTFQLNLAPDNNRGFREGMSWKEIEALIADLICEEELTPKGKGYPLSYHR